MRRRPSRKGEETSWQRQGWAKAHSLGSGSSIAVHLVGAAEGAVRKTVVWGQILMRLELGTTPELELQKLGSHRLALSQRCKARSGRMSPWAAVWTWAGKGVARSKGGQCPGGATWQD